MKNTLLLALLVNSVAAHSWLDCVDYDCPAAAPGAGPQTPAACTCKGYPRNWATVMAGVPFAADRGRDNRPGAAPANGGLFCDPGKEPDPGAGTGIPAGLYSAEYPMASLAKGQNVRWRWPAKNHANTPAAGTVEVFISSTPNTGDVFDAATPHIAQMSYSSDGGDCLGLATSTDTADCQGTWQVPTTLAEGRYTLMWWWEFNAGEFYNSCADVFITAAEGDPPAGVAAPPPPAAGGGGGGGAPADPANERSVVKVVMTVEGEVASFDAARRSLIAQTFAGSTGIAVGNIVVTVAEGYGTSVLGDGVVDVTVDIKAGSAAAALTAQNVLGSSLATPQEASAALAGAQVTVLRVQQVETVFPSQISVGGGAAEERDGWRASTLAVVALLAVGGGVVYFKFIKPKDAPGGRTAASNPPMVAVTQGKAQPPPPPPGQAPPAQVALPPGWFAHVDPASGHTYYVSEKGESTWSHPGAASISPV